MKYNTKGGNLLFMLMRLTLVQIVFLVAGGCMLYARDTKAQAILQQRISLELHNSSITAALDAIEEKTGIRFIYFNNLLDDARQASISFRDVEVNQILTSLFSPLGISYQHMRKEYVVLKKTHPAGAEGLGKLRIRTIRLLSPPVTPIRLLQQTVSGRVTDAAGEPLPGVSVLLKGTQNGTSTGIDGQYQLEQVPDGGVLVFSFMGFKTQEVPVKGDGSVDVTMEADVAALEEVVVVGYGTQRRSDVTSAISSVKAEDFVKGAATDAAQLIRGKVAGLAVVSPDGNPTSTSQINLRGIATIGASSTPLVLIDGVPGDLTTVAPENIASIDVLKDGSAAAIYGTRGTNGVILITTKEVNGETPATVDLNMYFTTQRITRELPFMGPSAYRQLVEQDKPGAFDYGANVNWLDEVSQTPVSQVYNISLKGGSRRTSYIANLNYRNMEGVIKRSNNVMLYPSLKVTHTMFDDKLKFDVNFSGYEQHYFSGADGGSYNNTVYKNALTYNPTDPIKDERGVWTEHTDKTDYANPVALLEESNGKNQQTNLRTSGTITYNPLNELQVKVLASRDLYNSVRGYSESKEHYSNVREGKNGYASRGTTRSEENILEITATYDKYLDDHHFTVLGGYSWLKYNNQDYWMQNWDFPTDQFSYNNMGAGLALKRGQAPEYSIQTENKLVGYFGRLNYSFKNRYLLTASIRREGSSKFGANYKYGNFPAVSAGWNIRQEPFMEGASFLSALKLRGGFGITGTEPTAPYVSLKRLNFDQFVYINGEWIQAAGLDQNPNPDLRWEKKEEANLGLDFGFLDDRITGSIDLYKRTTKDLLFDYPVATPPYLYSEIFANAASMENKGIELKINAAAVETDDFSWNTAVSYSTNRNKLLSLSDKNFQLASGYFDDGNTGEPIQQTTHRVQIGQPIGNFWGFKSIDVDESGHWIIEGKDGNPKPISEQQADDKQIIGNGLPKTYLSWNNSLSYKNFNLEIAMRGAFGFQILNMPRMFYSVPVMLTRGNLLSSAYDPVYGKQPLADDQELQYLSYYIEDGDYWKIDNITLSYTLRLDAKYLRSVRIYASSSNIKTFTGYSGIDPEVGILGMAPGVDDKYRYPAVTSYTLGAFFTF